MAFILDRLRRGVGLVGNTGAATDWFAILWDKTVGQIEATVSEIVATNARQDAQLAQLLAVQAAVNSQASGKPSGTSGPTSFGVSGAGRVTIGTVALTGVVAGTLRFDSTRIYIDGIKTAVTDAFSGTYWITEEPTSGGTETDILTGSWTADPVGPGEPVVIVFPGATVDAARPTATNTGDVTYRLEVARASGTAVLTNALATFRAAQA